MPTRERLRPERRLQPKAVSVSKHPTESLGLHPPKGKSAPDVAKLLIARPNVEVIIRGFVENFIPRRRNMRNPTPDRKSRDPPVESPDNSEVVITPTAFPGESQSGSQSSKSGSRIRSPPRKSAKKPQLRRDTLLGFGEGCREALSVRDVAESRVRNSYRLAPKSSQSPLDS